MASSHIQLTAKYRPQAFAEVVGQENIRTVLSRAAAQDRVAAAYLFSGTRGVGKTTLARIFAKALNCRTAPAPEPCNECTPCRQITRGASVDVAEIDGASNRGIEQARRLKEDVGYAPLDGRYKIIIIDEAHMLTKDAFNALLKTLEEPPRGVTFIMATTEPQKFPATIVSRCQHFVFKRLTQSQLDAHLRHVLEREGRPFEPAATTLLARRAAGSVRDGMSLLEQVLTIGEDTLRLEDVRRILGLAGGELFQRLVEAIRARDCIAVSDILRVLLDQGLDLGFFLRELTSLWRNLFLLRQAGDAALPLLELPDEEARVWQAVASGLSPTYIHAAWQLTLEGQRQALISLEPAQALEMLLLNLTYLPQLLRLEDLGQAVTATAAPTGSAAPSPSRSRSAADRSRAGRPGTSPQQQDNADALASAAPAAGPAGQRYPCPSGPPPAPAAQEPRSASAPPSTWAGFLNHYDALCKNEKVCLPGLRQVNGSLDGNELQLRCSSRFQYEGLQAPQKWRVMEKLLRDYFGAEVQIAMAAPDAEDKTTNGPAEKNPAAGSENGAGPGREGLQGQAQSADLQPEHPLVRGFVEQFQARVIAMEPRKPA